MEPILPPVPLPAVGDAEGLIDFDQRLRESLRLWNALTAEERRTFNKEAWLLNQARERREAADNARAYQARQEALRRQRLAEMEVETARTRAATCGDCFLVKTPTGRCNCTEG